MRIFITSILALTLVGASTGLAQQAPKIKEVSAKYTQPTSGAQMYREYCASCHGINGAGNGPAAPALKVAPADLTQLSRRNHGKFPELRVQEAISGQFTTPAHGNREMPVWGNVFKSLDNDPNMTKIRVTNLTNYIATMQQD